MPLNKPDLWWSLVWWTKLVGEFTLLLMPIGLMLLSVIYLRVRRILKILNRLPVARSLEDRVVERPRVHRVG